MISVSIDRDGRSKGDDIGGRSNEDDIGGRMDGWFSLAAARHGDLVGLTYKLHLEATPLHRYTVIVITTTFIDTTHIPQDLRNICLFCTRKCE